MANWTDLNTGINDNLTGVVMWGNNGAVTGKNGVYYTTTGGIGPASWTHFEITGNAADSLIYTNTQFTHCYAHTTHTNIVMACGTDTVNNKAIIMQFDLPLMTYTFRYIGATGTALNGIGFSAYSSNYFAVGDNGLIVKFTTSTNGTPEITSLTQDLRRIEFNSFKFAIACSEYRILGTDLTTSLQIDINVYQAGFFTKDVVYYNSSTVYASGNQYQHINSSNGVPTIYSYYDFGPLNARASTMRGSNLVVVTDHGAFYSTSGSNYTILQLEPSSLNYAFNEIWNTPSTNQTFACGANGLLMSSYGEVGYPYGAINGNASTCVNVQNQYNSVTSPGSTRAWYVDNVYTTTSPSIFTTFTTAGTHEIMLLTTANSMVDTFILNVEVYDLPQVDFSFTLTDTILCHKEPLEIMLDTSEQYVHYWLYDSLFSQNYGVSGVGTGSPLIFTTDSLTLTGTYYLQAEHTLGMCTVDFTIPIEVTVEQTKAAYHNGYINAAIGEQAMIMENCTDADNYAWTFTPSASPGTSSIANPMVSFGIPGGTTVDLICWSNNFCYDSVTGPGPNIYIPPSSIDSCWINEKRGVPGSWPGFYISEMADLHDVDNGYLVTGSYSADTLESQHGVYGLIHNNGTFLESRGGYMAKFDYEGTLKWIVHDRSLGSITTNKGLITDAETDSQGNIYICGHNLYRFFDNGGDSIEFGGSYLMKLDSLGRYIWHAKFSGSSSYIYRKNMYLAVDQDDDVYCGGMESDYYTEADGNVVPLNTSGSYNLKIIKIDQNGNYLWHTGINSIGVNTDKEIEELEVDLNKNIYSTGKYSQTLNLYSSGNSTAVFTTTGSTTPKTFVAKWDSVGQFDWCTRITSSGQNGGGGYYEKLNYPRDMYVDPSTGEAYVTGRTDFGYLSNAFLVTNTVGLTDTLDIGGLYLVKFKTNGDVDWASGTDMLSSTSPILSPYGCGEEVFLQNDTIYLAGIIRNDNTNLNSITGSINYWGNDDNFFVARFNTTGGILDLLKSGNNSNEVSVSQPGIEGLFKKDGAYYATRNAKLNSSTSIIPELGDTVSTNDVVAWVDKFYGPCGIYYLPGYNISNDVTVCPGDDYTFPDGYTETNITSSLTHVSFLTTSNGSDSTIYTNVTLNLTYLTTVNADVCFGANYTFPGGSTLTNITSNVIDTTVLNSAVGCDSTIITNLTVTVVNTAVTSAGPVLTADLNGAAYVWLNCDSVYAEVNPPGYNQSYQVMSTGNYAVQVMSNNCTDTSTCVFIDVNGLEVIDKAENIEIYPNPTFGKIKVQNRSNHAIQKVILLDMYGKKVQEMEDIQNDFSLEITGESGIYFLLIKYENEGNVIFKVTKLGL